jgi:hypothetical protein
MVQRYRPPPRMSPGNPSSTTEGALSAIAFRTGLRECFRAHGDHAGAEVASFGLFGGCVPPFVARLEGRSPVLCERHTKVNRCLSEGRRAFHERVAGIEAGAECERLGPSVSALADGEAGADELAALRPHLKTCLSCRARLRDYRAAPSRVAALVPPALVAASGNGDAPGALRSLVESIVGATHDKAAALGERAHAAAELATGQKLAAVAASAAALAGGGAAGVERLSGDPPERPVQVEPVKQERVPTQVPVESQPVEPAPASTPQPAPAQPEPPPADPADEFAPGATAAAAPAASPPPAAPVSFAPGRAAPAGGAGGEFGP